LLLFCFRKEKRRRNFRFENVSPLQANLAIALGFLKKGKEKQQSKNKCELTFASLLAKTRKRNRFRKTR